MEWRIYHFKKIKNASFKGIVDLETNTSHKFKYLIDGTYDNEIEADGYAWSGFSGAEKQSNYRMIYHYERKKSFQIIENSSSIKKSF